MSPLWKPEFETGHWQVDADHRQVLEHLEVIRLAIDNGGHDQIAPLLTTLQEYVLRHFGREEAYMLRANCPAYHANCRAHHDFTEQLAGWMEVAGRGSPSPELAREIHQQATAWIESHIVQVDCRLRGCGSPSGRAQSTGLAGSAAAGGAPGN